MNSPETPPSNRFPKQERICRKDTFDYLFEHGSSYQAGVLKFFFIIDPPPHLVTVPLSMAVAVPKRTGFKRANLRNLMKRRIREAYRLQKHELEAALALSERKIAFLVRFNPPKPVSYATVAGSMAKGFRFFLKQIAPPPPPTDVSADQP